MTTAPCDATVANLTGDLAAPPARVSRTTMLRILGLVLSVLAAVLAAPAVARAASGPTNTAPPVIGGNMVVGGRMTAHPGTWTGLPALGYAYTWYRCSSPDGDTCAEVVGTGPSYVPNPLDAQKWLKIRVEVANSELVASATSTPVGPISETGVAPGLPPTNVSPPVISGNARVGEMLDASEGRWYADAHTAFEFQWKRCSGGTCSNVTGAVLPYYVVTGDDAGHSLTVAVKPTSAPGSPPSVWAILASVSPPAVCDGASSCNPDPCEPPYWKPGVAQVTMYAPTALRPDGADLRWSGSAGQYFRSYQIHRSKGPDFTDDVLLATLTDPASVSYSDTTAGSESDYRYWVVLVTTCTDVASREQPVSTPALDDRGVIVPVTSTTKATTLVADSTDSSSVCRNAGADPKLVVGVNDRAVYRAIVWFDLSSIPANARIRDASLTFNVVRGPANAADLVVRGLGRAWQEGTGVLSSPSCGQDGATWQRADPATPWTALGGDFDGAAWDSFALGGADDRESGRLDISVGPLVQRWISGMTGNYGLVLEADPETLGADRTFELASDDAAPALQPNLEVTYSTAPEPEQDIQVGEYSDGTDANAVATGVEDPTDGVFETAPVLPSDVVAGPTTERVRVMRSKAPNKNVTFINDEGEWTIYLDCVPPDAAAGRHSTVGPGYIAVFRDRQIVNASTGQRANVLMVNGRQDELTGPTGSRQRRHIFEAGGLGLFGWHHARGRADNTLAADTTGSTMGRGGRQFFAIEGQRCAEGVYSDPVAAGDEPFQRTGYGVRTQQILNPGCVGPDEGTENWRSTTACRLVNDQGVGFLDMEVIFQDRWQDVMRVVYRWRFRPEGVKLWFVAEPLATPIPQMADPYCESPPKPAYCSPTPPTMTGTPFIKEPKLVTSLLGTPPAHTRMFVFKQHRRKKMFDANAPFQGSMRGGDKGVVGTMLFGELGRTRVRWGYMTLANPTSKASEDTAAALEVRNFPPDRDNCPTKNSTPTEKTKPCFSVVMRAYDPDKIYSQANRETGYNLGDKTYLWRSGTSAERCTTSASVEQYDPGFGFDQWACDMQTQPRAFSSDSVSQNNPQCQNRRNYDVTAYRNWELAGRKDQAHFLSNPDAYTVDQTTGEKKIKRTYYENNLFPFDDIPPFLGGGTAGALFLSWQGGQGYTDCEPLLRSFLSGTRPSGRKYRYGVYATFGLNNTYKLQAQGGDS